MVPEETKWLYKEIWIWRGFGLLIVVVLIMLEAYEWHSFSSHQVSVEKFQASVVTEQERELGILNKVYGELQELDKNERAAMLELERVHTFAASCMRCHQHPQAWIDNMLKKPDKK